MDEKQLSVFECIEIAEVEDDVRPLPVGPAMAVVDAARRLRARKTPESLYELFRALDTLDGKATSANQVGTDEDVDTDGGGEQGTGDDAG